MKTTTRPFVPHLPKKREGFPPGQRIRLPTCVPVAPRRRQTTALGPLLGSRCGNHAPGRFAPTCNSCRLLSGAWQALRCAAHQLTLPGPGHLSRAHVPARPYRFALSFNVACRTPAPVRASGSLRTAVRWRFRLPCFGLPRATSALRPNARHARRAFHSPRMSEVIGNPSFAREVFGLLATRLRNVWLACCHSSAAAGPTVCLPAIRLVARLVFF